MRLDPKNVLIFGTTSDTVKLGRKLLEKKCTVTIATNNANCGNFRQKLKDHCSLNKISSDNVSAISLPDTITSYDPWATQLFDAAYDVLCILPPDKGVTRHKTLLDFWGDPKDARETVGFQNLRVFAKNAAPKMKHGSLLFFRNWAVKEADPVRANKQRLLRTIAEYGSIRGQDIAVASVKIDEKVLEQGSVTSRLRNLFMMNRINLVLQNEIEFVR